MAIRILVVEDDEELNEILDYNLSRGGYEVLRAWDGVEAMRLLDEQRPDLVLLDLMLPLADGWQVCEHMRGSEPLKDTPVIIFTARSARDDFDQARRYNPAGYFTKPYATPDVLRHVEKVVAATRAARAAAGNGDS